MGLELCGMTRLCEGPLGVALHIRWMVFRSWAYFYAETKGAIDAESPVVPKTQKSQPKKISFFMVLHMVGLLALE